MVWGMLLSSNRIRRISGNSHLLPRDNLMCVFSYVLCVWLLNTRLPIWVCVSVQHWPPHLSTHQPALPSSTLPAAETNQDRRANNASSLRVSGLLARRRGKDLFHCCVNHCFISTLLSPSLWYFAGFLAPVQVWTQYGYWDHGSHLLAWAGLCAWLRTRSFHFIVKLS